MSIMNPTATPIVDHMYHVNTGAQFPVVAYQRYQVVATLEDTVVVAFSLTDRFVVTCELDQHDAEELPDEGRLAFVLEVVDDYHRTYSDEPTGYPIQRLDDGSEVLVPINADYHVVVRYVTVRRAHRSTNDFVAVH